MFSLNRYLFISWLFVVVILFNIKVESSAISDQEPMILISSEVIALGEYITLGDIAEIISDDVEVKQRLQSISLGLSPSLGTIRELPHDKLLLAIAASGFTESEINLQAPPIIKIQRASRIVEYPFIREAVENAALNELRKMGIIAHLVRLDLPSVIEIPAGEAEVHAYVGGVKDLFAPFIASVEFWVDGKIVKRLSVTAQAEAYAQVWVPLHDVTAGERLREKDGHMKMIQLKHPLSKYLRDPKKLCGVSVRKSVARDEPVLLSELFADTVIRAGDMVRIVGQGGNVVVEVTGEARSAGRIGERVQVKNVQSGIILQGIVKDEGLVQVYF